MEGLVNDLNTEEPIVFTMDKEGKEEDLFVHATSEGGDTSQVTFVDDCLVAVAVAEALPPPDEYETDSGDYFSDREDEDIAHVTVSRSGQPNIFCLLLSSQRACRWASAIFPDHFISANHNWAIDKTIPNQISKRERTLPKFVWLPHDIFQIFWRWILMS